MKIVYLLITALLTLSVHADNNSPLNIKNNPFYQEAMPTIPFTAVSNGQSGSKLVMVSVDKIKFFDNKDGQKMLFAGSTDMCSEYSTLFGSESRQCLKTERVNLVRTAEYSASYCTFRSGDECQSFKKSSQTYPLKYQVAVMKRKSISDSFSSNNVVSTRIVKITECTECANLN